MRCHPNLKLFYCLKPQNLYCCHPSKPSRHCILCESAPPPPFPPPHTRFSPTLLKICLPARTRTSAWTLQSQDTIPWPTTFAFLPPPHLPTHPRSGPLLPLSSLLDHLLALLARKPHAVWVPSQRPWGESFSGSDEHKHAFEGKASEGQSQRQKRNQFLPAWPAY